MPQWGLSWCGQSPRVHSSGRPARVAVSHSHLRHQCWAWGREGTYTVALASPRPLETSASGPAVRQTLKGWFLWILVALWNWGFFPCLQVVESGTGSLVLSLPAALGSVRGAVPVVTVSPSHLLSVWYLCSFLCRSWSVSPQFFFCRNYSICVDLVCSMEGSSGSSFVATLDPVSWKHQFWLPRLL